MKKKNRERVLYFLAHFLKIDRSFWQHIRGSANRLTESSETAGFHTPSPASVLVPFDSWCQDIINMEFPTERLFAMSAGIHILIFTCVDHVKVKDDI